MSGGYSEVQIYNLVFDHLEEEAAVTIDDARAPVKWLKRNFAIHRDALLRGGQWGFALKQSAIPEDSVKPPFQYSHRYVVPGDCLRVLPFVYASVTGYTPYQRTIIGNYIHTNVSSPLNATYVSRIATTGDFDPLFTLTLASRLAVAMAHWMTGKEGIIDKLREINMGYRQEAQEVDQIEQNYTVPYDDELLLSRE